MAEDIAATATRTRDRGRTEEAIIAAARAVLAEQGFQGFGINAIARQAGCDKQLIYRYYGGLDGLAEAIGNDVASGLRARLAEAAGNDPPDSYAALIEMLVLGFIEVLRGDSLLQRIVAWEVSAPGPMVIRFAAARSLALQRAVERQRGSLVAPEGVDAAAINAFLIAGAQHLVLSAAAIGGFAGLQLADDAGWERIRTSVRQLVRAVYR